MTFYSTKTNKKSFPIVGNIKESDILSDIIILGGKNILHFRRIVCIIRIEQKFSKMGGIIMTTLLAKIDELEKENATLRIDNQNLAELLTELKKYLEKAAA